MPALVSLNIGENPALDLPSALRVLASIPTLRELSIAGAKLSALPEQIGELTQLESLSLSYNQLTTLPSSLARLTGLRRLRLSNNPERAALEARARELVPGVQLDS